MKKLIKVFLLDLAFFVSTIFILILGRFKLREMLLTLQNYGPELNALDPNQDISGTQALLFQVSSSATKIYIFLFLILPLIIFILYVVMQGASFYILKEQKNFYLKFIIASLIPVIFLVLTIALTNYYFLIPFLISSYLAFFLYFKDLKEIKLALKKIYIYFPLYLVYLVLSLLALSAYFMTDASYKTNLFYLYLISGIIIVILFSLYKIQLIKKLT